MEIPSEGRRPHLAMVSSPGMGHLFPLAELAKILVNRHRFTVTFITFAASDNRAAHTFLSTLPSGISWLTLPPVPLDDIPPAATIETRMSLVSLRSLPAIRSALADLHSTTNLVAVVADFFATDAFAAARDIGVPYYMFIPTNLLFLSLLLELPALDTAITGRFQDLETPLRLSGCVPIPGSDILTPLLNRSSEEYRWMLHHARLYRQAQGILVNSFAAIEPGPTKSLSQNSLIRPPVYPVGPMVQSPKPGTSLCLAWLDRQPEGSVLFVSFGSGGTLTRTQLGELALGLEASKQRFLLVVRSPCDEDSSSTYFTAQTKDDPLLFLPEGFVDRTRDVGLVVPSWAPQIEVLAHRATGGFLSHCGWNSTLESVSHGVPLIAWPLFAEQFMNAVMLVEEARVAMRPKKADAAAAVDRAEVSRVAAALMEGEEGKALRRRAQQLKEAAHASLREGGSSYEALGLVADMWKEKSAGAGGAAAAVAPQ